MDLFSERARPSCRRSFITGLDRDVTQIIEYFPSGEVFVEIDGGDSPIPLKTINKERGKIIRTLTIHLISLMVRSRMMRRDIITMGRDTTIQGLNADPLAEKFPGWSPYVYTFNNSVKFVDLDGMDPLPYYMRTAAIRIATAGLNSVGRGIVKGNSGAEKLMNALMMDYAAKHNMT